MKIIKAKNYDDMSKKAADIVINQIQKKPDSVICFATGNTVLGFYKNLISAYKKNKVDFSNIISFNLDEYYPIKKKNKNSFYNYMYKNLFNQINIKKSNINLFNGETKNPKKECQNYEKKLKKHRIDLEILGIGVNGHIAYNEPDSSFNSKTRIIQLDKKTIKTKSKHFKSEKQVPTKAMTMGLKNIMAAKKIILLAAGKHKANAIKHLIKGKVDKKWPASILKKHKNVTLIVGNQALS